VKPRNTDKRFCCELFNVHVVVVVVFVPVLVTFFTSARKTQQPNSPPPSVTVFNVVFYPSNKQSKSHCVRVCLCMFVLVYLIASCDNVKRHKSWCEIATYSTAS